MAIERDYTEPRRLPGENNWAWCQRYAKQIPADTLKKIMVEAWRLRRVDIRRRRRPYGMWSYVGDASGHGSGVSTAIVERWRTERAARLINHPTQEEVDDAIFDATEPWVEGQMNDPLPITSVEAALGHGFDAGFRRGVDWMLKRAGVDTTGEEE